MFKIFRMFKWTFRLIVLGVILFFAWPAYSLYQSGELNYENYTNKIQQMLGEVKEKASNLKENPMSEIKSIGSDLKGSWESFDWNNLRDQLGLSGEDLDSYKKFLSEDESKSEAEIAIVEKTPPEKIAPPPITTPKTSPSLKAHPKLKKPAKQAEPVQKAPSKNDQIFEKAESILAKAKALNRKSLGGGRPSKSSMKQATRLYEQSRNEYQKIYKSSSSSRGEKAKAEKALEKINMMIYWNKKFSTV